jgi:hypothetical protein
MLPPALKHPSVTEAFMARNRQPEYRYELDRGDCIRYLNTAFTDFAMQNGAPDLRPANLIGRSLWHFVTGLEIRHLYKLMFTKIRTTDRTIVVPFRCDSPTCRRYMELTIARAADGGLALAGELLREEYRTAAPLLDATQSRSEQFVKMCSWCKRMWVPAGEWLEVEDAVVPLQLFEGAVLPRVICPPCEKRLLDEMGVEGAA